ncbi:MAG: hypothetical protein IJY58_05740 [Alphaproteobacteria bacterium]|nr:hypothetical protein [Alphaproteobacteria bacterium]
MTDKDFTEFLKKQENTKHDIWHWVCIAGLFGALIGGAVTSYQTAQMQKVPLKQNAPKHPAHIKTYE